LHPTYKLRKSLQIAQEYAALHAGIDAAIEPSAHAGLPDTRAGIDAAFDAGEREDREDINLPSSTSDVGREGIKTAATDNGPRPPVANNGKAPGELSEEELRRLEVSGETGKQLATRVRKRRGAPA